MRAFVLDCSMTLAWSFADEATPATEAMLAMARQAPVHVPSLWFLEVANVQLAAEKKGRATRAQNEAFLALLGLLDIREDRMPLAGIQPRIADLAREEKLTVYDATYLELALREGLPLATLDADLRKAAKRVGVELAGEQAPPSRELREEPAVAYGAKRRKRRGG